MGNCPGCGATARPQARFCSKCGTPLVTGAGITPPPPPLSPFERQSFLQSSIPAQLSAPTEEIQVAPVIPSQAEAASSDAGRQEAAAEVVVPSTAPLAQNEAIPSDTATLPVPSVEAEAREEEAVAGTGNSAPALTREVPGGDAARESQQESVPLVVGKADVITHHTTIAGKLLSLVPYARQEYREGNRALFERLVQQQMPVEEPLWEKVAFVAGMYAPQMGGNRLSTRRKLDLWQALLWAVQYEYYFHPAQFADRFFRLAEFLSTCASDGDFQAIAFNSLETVLPLFEKPFLKNARNSVERLPVSSTVTSLKHLIARYIALSEPISLLAALECTWHRLDRNREEQNRTTVADIRRHGLTPQLTARLVAMSVFVCRNLLEQSSSDSANDPSDEELQAALLLSTFACRKATGSYISEARKWNTSLKEMEERRAHRLQEAGQIRPEPPEPQSGSAEVNGKKEEYAAMVGASNSAQNGRIAQEKPPVEDLQETLPEDPRHRLEAVLGEETLLRLLDSLRNFRLDAMRSILREVRIPLLSALSNALTEPSLDELVPPAHVFYMRGNVQDETLPYLRKRLLSSDMAVRRDALAQLEQAIRSASGRENAALAREWLLFARAQALGLDKVLPTWREDYTRGIASPEEIWNLAVIAVRGGDTLQALEMLQPGVGGQRVPFSHLRFALKCGVDILLKEANSPGAAASKATAFLLSHLTRFPLLECCLVWLLLTNDSQETLDLIKQAEVISVFLALLDRPFQILAGDRGADEVTIEECERDYRDLLSIIKQLEERYTLEPADGKIIIKSRMLATTLRVAQPLPKRVGLFVDYENIVSALPPEFKANPRLVAAFLTQYAEKYGEVVCRWLCVSPANIFNFDAMAEEFQRVGFKVQYPRGVTAQLKPDNNQADFVLVECIVHEMLHSGPDVYLIVSGDAHYFERISRLIEQGCSVGLVAFRDSVSSRYQRLAQRSKQGQLPEAYGPFFLDYLEDILAAYH
ncbi:MAG TPA: NYN domain-containing protein [Ktedonobacteraceae bacterium]|nr:NYN domain-containing protein [Ktedonobacteraceae bacterium]